jgi:AbrB family looped-hinge helix DNA binding protein
MGIHLLVTERGQVTLPAAFRAKMGIKPGDVIVAEEKEGGILLQATTVVPYRDFSGQEIKAWVAADAMSPEMNAKWEKKFGKPASAEKSKRKK